MKLTPQEIALLNKMQQLATQPNANIHHDTENFTPSELLIYNKLLREVNAGLHTSPVTDILAAYAATRKIC